MKHRARLFLAFWLIFSLSCRLVTERLTRDSGRLELVTFAEDVIDGQPYHPASEFPGGTYTVWAYITFEGMKDGDLWSRVWEKDGESFYEALDESWEEGESGWVAYSISEDDDTPLDGEYTLKLYLGEELVQQASFSVARDEQPEAGGPPDFGSIQFALGVTEARLPIQPASEFATGVAEVFAIFPYSNIPYTQIWRYEWLEDGEVTASVEDSEWGGQSDGTTYLSLTYEGGFRPGTYTLNLYLDDELARSGSFAVGGPAPTPSAPARPEDIIDADLMPAWEILYYASDTYNFLHDLAQFVLDHHIQIRMDESYDGSAMAYYRKDEDQCQPNYSPGYVAVMRQTWNENSWEELAGILAHELEHAMQHYQGGNYRCPGCSVYKEYHALIVQYYTWLMIGRQDLIPDGLYDSSGTFSPDLLWEVVMEAYGGECPVY